MTEEREDSLLEDFTATRDRYEALTAEIDSVGRESVNTLADAVVQLDRLLRTYEDRATGTGDFGGYIAFRQQVEDLVEDLPADIPHADAFDTIAATVDKRRLSERDFEAIQDTLTEVRSTATLLEDESTARDEYRDIRRDVAQRIDEIDEELDHMDHLLSLAEVDLDAPVEEIRTPIDAYNQAVREAYDAYLESTPASEVLAFLNKTDRYPLVPMPTPPAGLVSYVEDLPEPLTVRELLEYADYSRSKLAHYVEAPDTLVTAVATDRTYLERLSADPFEITWPPSEAAILEWRIRELIAVVDRFGTEDTMTKLRTVRARVQQTDRFDRLRDIAVARSTIDQDQRERIQSGELAADRGELAAFQERLADALERSPTV